jgi:hypothetical protein
MDESYADQKNLLSYYVGKNTTPLSLYAVHNYPQSHHAVLNNFRADFEDFSHFQDLSTRCDKTLVSGADSNLFKSNMQYVKFTKHLASEHGTSFNGLNLITDASPLQSN